MIPLNSVAAYSGIGSWGAAETGEPGARRVERRIPCGGPCADPNPRRTAICAARGPPVPNVWPTRWLALPNVDGDARLKLKLVRFDTLNRLNTSPISRSSVARLPNRNDLTTRRSCDEKVSFSE